jgi:P27 family predicted phage terminase small subunit
MARLKTPTNILDARGSWRAKTRKGEPVSKAGKTDPPPYISEKGKAHWPELQYELAAMGVYSDADRLGLSLICDALADYLDARKLCETQNIILKSKEGVFYQAPWVGVKNRAFDRVSLLIKQYGFTPAARASLTVGDNKGEADNPLEKVMSR